MGNGEWWGGCAGESCLGGNRVTKSGDVRLATKSGG